MNIGFGLKNCPVSSNLISVPETELQGRENKGLPDEKSRRDLARTYLEVQTRHWPELVALGVLPPLTEENVNRLAEEFAECFLAVSVEAFQTTLVPLPWQDLAEAYLRYSCDNSNPRSLDQQLRNILEKAAGDRVFIPWRYVFADAAISGTVTSRRGYQLVKAVIQNKPAGVKRLYIDELGRANRDAIEALRLGRMLEQLGKRTIGASDGFDSILPNSQFLLSMYAALHQWFVEQLRAKVKRGMKDAFENGGNIRPPAVGYKLIPKRTADGTLVVKPNGQALSEKVIDELTAPYVEEAFLLYVEQEMSPLKIARRFNDLGVNKKNTWDRASIVKLLTRTTYIGVEYDGKTRRVQDFESDQVRFEPLPESEWRRREVPHLLIVPDELFERAQQRLQECSEAYAPIFAKR